MKCRRLESGIGNGPRNRRWSAVVETVLLLALAAGANPAQWRERPATKEPLPQRATAVIGRPEVPASRSCELRDVSCEQASLCATCGGHSQHGTGNSGDVLRLRALSGRYIDLVLMCEQGFADVAKSLAGGIGSVRARLHCGQALLAERLQAGGLTLSDTASTEDDGCAL